MRWLNVVAAERCGIGACRASGRALTGTLLARGARAVFRARVVAVAVARARAACAYAFCAPRTPPRSTSRTPRDEASGGEDVRVTLDELRPPREPRSGVLAVFQLAGHSAPSAPDPSAWETAERGAVRPLRTGGRGRTPGARRDTGALTLPRTRDRSALALAEAAAVYRMRMARHLALSPRAHG